MHINVQGSKDPATGKDLWIDLAEFKKTKEVRGRAQDYVGWIMNATLSELDAKEKVVRYFVRCSNLYAKLAAGRNQGSLKAIIGSPMLALSYDQILAVLREATLPYLLRARYFTLMSKLYVDRDPQIQTPQVLYTRVWSKVKPEESDLDMTMQAQVASIPVCTTGFKDLEAFLLTELPKLADCTDTKGRPSLNGEPRIGQLEMMSAIILITDELVGFGFFVDRGEGQEDMDLSKIVSIYKSLVAVLDTREDTEDKISSAAQKAKIATRATDMSVEARFRCDLRSDALNLLLRFFNLRLDSRLTSVIRAWETIFEKIENGPGGLSRLKVPAVMSAMSGPLSSAPSSGALRGDSGAEVIMQLQETFREFDGLIRGLDQTAFGKNIVSPPEIGTDVYKPNNYHDSTIAIMLDLCSFKHQAVTKACLSLVVRNMSQRVSVTSALKDVQILVLPTAVKVYQETQFVIKKLGSLHKHLNADKPEAYQEAGALLVHIYM